MGATDRARITATNLGLLVCLFASCLVARAQDNSQQTADPVADAARKAREEKKTAAKPKKVFTEDDIAPQTATKELQQPAVSASAADAQPNANPSGDGTTPAAKGDHQPKESDEVMWRRRFRDARNRLAAAQKQLDILQRDLNKSELQYYPDPQKAMKEQYSREGIKERTEKIDRQKAEVAKLKQTLIDMEDELRKSGGDIGWARE